MSGVFITGTGTDIGKTFVTAALIRRLRAAGQPVHAIKPVVTGFDQDSLTDSDPAVLLAALACPISLQEIERVSPWRFKAPVSPNMAAGRESRAIHFAEIVEFCRKSMQARRGTLLIEGIGGIMVPLDEHRTVLDWMSVLRLPVVVVTGSYVGTISHTLTCLEVMARRNLDILVLVVSESPGSAASLADTVDTLQRFADSVEVVAIPRLASDAHQHPGIAQIAALL